MIFFFFFQLVAVHFFINGCQAQILPSIEGDQDLLFPGSVFP